MLTKDLLKYKIRKGELFPEFLSPSSEGPYKLAELVLAGLIDAKGLSLAELERRWDDSGVSLYSQGAGFKKVVLDQMDWQEPDDLWHEKRLELLLEAQSQRQEHLYPEKEAFQESFAEMKGQSYPELARQLYQDLPEERPVRSTPDFIPETLISRYNCALAQSLLIRCSELRLHLFDMGVSDLRKLFQSLRFHQLVAEFEPGYEKGSELRLIISGPLSVLEGAQKYGLKLANFLPRILLCKKWHLSAVIEPGTGKKSAVLNLSHESGLRSHYKEKLSYTPEEFREFYQRFNDESPEWKVSDGTEFIHLGDQSWCFPDFEFRHPSGKTVHLELFHKWHQGSLPSRIKVLKKNPARNLLLGVCRSLSKKSELKKLLEESEWFQNQGIFFREFPTVKSILTILGRFDSVC